MLDWAAGAERMPRFFFHVRDSGDYLDDEGTELADDSVARAEAVILSGELLKDLGGKFWNYEDWQLVVVAEDGREVCRLTITAAAPEVS